MCAMNAKYTVYSTKRGYKRCIFYAGTGEQLGPPPLWFYPYHVCSLKRLAVT